MDENDLRMYREHKAAVERMTGLDRLPKEWRDLANEYGAVVTLAMANEGYTLEQATSALEARHYRRQEQLLSTDYHIDREKFLRLARGTSRRPNSSTARNAVSRPRAFGQS